MKGLLLKDWYMMKKYCKAFLLVAAIFLAISCVSDIVFFVFYPSFLCSLIPINLLSHDESSGWMFYSGTLPYTKRQIVSSKYLFGLFSTLAVTVVTAVFRALHIAFASSGTAGSTAGGTAAGGGSDAGNFLILLAVIWIFAMLSSSLCMPFIFRYGTEKGRLAYYVTVVLFFAFLSGAPAIYTLPQDENILTLLFVGILLLAIGIYALSWHLSVVFYSKREL